MVFNSLCGVPVLFLAGALERGQRDQEQTVAHGQRAGTANSAPVLRSGFKTDMTMIFLASAAKSRIGGTTVTIPVAASGARAACSSVEKAACISASVGQVALMIFLPSLSG